MKFSIEKLAASINTNIGALKRDDVRSWNKWAKLFYHLE